MQYIIPGIFLFATLIVLLAFFNLRLAIALYISYMILVPFLQFSIAGISLSYNIVNIILLLSFLNQWKQKKRHIDFVLIFPFLLLFMSLFILTFLEWDTPMEIQLSSLRSTFMKSCIVSLIIWNVSLTDSKSIKYIKWALIISIVIAGVYGLILMNLGGLNPYTSFLSSYFNSGSDAADVYSSGESRLSFSSAGKIQSTMIHPMTWGLNLCFLIIIFLKVSFKEKIKGYWILIALMMFNLLISGVRTGIASLSIVGIYYLFMNRNYKTFFFATILVFSGYLIISTNQDLSNIFSSFTDVKGTKSDVGGSSISMRLEQLEGVFKEIKHNELFGKGYSWTAYYQSIKGDHPVILAFESLVFVILCNNGFIGLFLWSIFFLLLFKLNRKIVQVKTDILFLDMLVLVYLTYAIGTGEYGYLPIFSIYYSFLFAYIFYHQRLQTNKKTFKTEDGKTSSVFKRLTNTTI
jgi:hypothetical protein